MTDFLKTLADEEGKCHADITGLENEIEVLRARISGIQFSRLAFGAVAAQQASDPEPLATTPVAEKPARKPRRTRAQIEQDNLRAASDPTRPLGYAEAKAEATARGDGAFDIPAELQRRA